MNKGILAAVAAFGLLAGTALGAAAEDEDVEIVAAAGNGGVATADASGGYIYLGDIFSQGSVVTVTVSADGGVAIADASGGDDNEAENDFE